MVYLDIDDNKIPLGNFAFLYDITKSEDLFKKFYNAEKNLKIDYMDFAHKIRKAYEAFALEEEAKKRKQKPEFENMVIDDIKKTITDAIKEPSSIINYKNIIVDLCDGREKDFAEMLFKYSYVKHPDDVDEVRRKLKKYIRFLYSFGSESSHENVAIDECYIPNKANCLMVAGSFHDFLCAYYGVEKKYDSTLVPIRDYVSVPKKVAEAMGLSLDVGKSLYVKSKNDKINYFIFSNDKDGISYGQRRDIDTINKLWEDNFDDPSNIIRKTENITSSNGDFKFQIYALPNRPYKLTLSLLDDMSVAEKLDIITGLCKGIDSIHNYDTPMYHRNICPDAFYIFRIKNKYKTLLARFDCTKDTANKEFTVYCNVEKKVRNENTKQFFAPEVIDSDVGKQIDWRKADIYSLGKTIMYILAGASMQEEEYDDFLEKCDISDEMKIIVSEMLSKQPEKRPEIAELLEVL